MREVHDHHSFGRIVAVADWLMSFFTLLAIFGVVLFIGIEVYMFFDDLLNVRIGELLHTVALIIILIKAYMLLLFYMQSHHVSIKYVVEISIVAPAVELIFAASGRSFAMNVLYAVFAVASMVIYAVFYKQLHQIDDRCKHEAEEAGH